jgi:phosphoribosylformimino-5-aminoimidazole carboxamide ribotide isomerase
MRVIPVLDLRAGLAVAAVAGERDRYGLLRGTAEGCNPLAWARRFRDQMLAAESPDPPALYVADLDAIEGQPPHLELLSSLAGLGVTLWVDAGVRTADDVPPLLAAGVETIIVGLETVSGPEALAAILDDAGPERVCFGLDLKDHRPLGDPSGSWGTDDPLALARRAIELGVRKVLVLDLARIGTGQGTGTDSLLSAIRDACPAIPSLELIAGGGVSGPADLHRLAERRVDAVLVGSALRDGQLRIADLRARHRPGPEHPPHSSAS